MYLPLIAAFIAVSGSMGVSFMAGDSVPGDPLYSVKIHINESVKHLTAIRPEAEATVSVEIIARRAQEARRLEAEGRLNNQTKDLLSKEIRSELKILNKATSGWLDNDSSSSQAEVFTKLESQMETDADIFERLGVSLERPPVVEANSSAAVYLDATSVDEGATPSDANLPFEVTNTNASTSLDAREVINVR